MLGSRKLKTRGGRLGKSNPIEIRQLAARNLLWECPFRKEKRKFDKINSLRRRK